MIRDRWIPQIVVEPLARRFGSDDSKLSLGIFAAEQFGGQPRIGKAALAQDKINRPVSDGRRRHAGTAVGDPHNRVVTGIDLVKHIVDGRLRLAAQSAQAAHSKIACPVPTTEADCERCEGKHAAGNDPNQVCEFKGCCNGNLVTSCKQGGGSQCQQGIGLIVNQADHVLELDRRGPDMGDCGLQAELVDAQLQIFIEICFEQSGGVRLCHVGRLATGQSPDNAISHLGVCSRSTLEHGQLAQVIGLDSHQAVENQIFDSGAGGGAYREPIEEIRLHGRQFASLGGL